MDMHHNINENLPTASEIVAAYEAMRADFEKMADEYVEGNLLSQDPYMRNMIRVAYLTGLYAGTNKYGKVI
jgi:hypothetical protein